MEEKDVLLKEIEELKEQKEKLEKEMISNIAKAESYNFKEIMKNKDVQECKNILAVDYHLKHFMRLIDVIGFDKVNKEFFEIWENMSKKEQEEED